MGWFAQREAFRRNAELVVMGHTHASVSRLETSLVNYASSGFMCPSAADIPSKFVSYATVNLDSPPTVQNMQLVRRGGGIAGNPFAAPSTSIVQEPFMDYSCYAQIDNPINGEDLLLAETRIGNGHFHHPSHRDQARVPRHSVAARLPERHLALPRLRCHCRLSWESRNRCSIQFRLPDWCVPEQLFWGQRFPSQIRRRPVARSWQGATDGPPAICSVQGHPWSGGRRIHGKVRTGFLRNQRGWPTTRPIARLNGATDLSNCIVANNEAKVFSIRLDKASGPEEYRLTVRCRRSGRPVLGIHAPLFHGPKRRIGIGFPCSTTPASHTLLDTTVPHRRS